MYKHIARFTFEINCGESMKFVAKMVLAGIHIKYVYTPTCKTQVCIKYELSRSKV